MKHIKLLILLMFMFLTGCTNSKPVEQNPNKPNEPSEQDPVEKEEDIRNILKEYLASIDLPEEATENLVLASSATYKGHEITISWESNSEAISSSGLVTKLDDDVLVEIKAVATCNTYEESRTFENILVKSRLEEIFYEVYNKLDIEKVITEDIVLPKEIDGVRIEWSSSNDYAINEEGKYFYVKEDTKVTLSALLIFGKNDKYLESKDFEVIVKTYPAEKKLELAMANIIIPEVVSESLNLKETYEYETSAKWTSSNEEVIKSDGTVTLTYQEENVTLTLVLESNGVTMSKNFKVRTVKMELTEMQLQNHTLVDRAKDYIADNMENVKLSEGKLVLEDGKTEGTYTSLTIKTKRFFELVASWSAISSITSTCELQIQVLVDGEWSKYFTYGVWGLGRNNLYYNQEDTKVYMNTDEIKLKDSYNGSAFRYKITLRRDTVSDESPKLSLVAVTLNINNYSYDVDTTALPDKVDYDVPMLCQREVPEIGGVICSATTSTMLLKYKGFNFKDKDQYEHRYIASLVADRGHNNPTYGNWVYNTVTIGAFGLDAYVARMYSWDELKYHLANAGPVGISIKGYTGYYTTGGHLMVARGYKVVNGKTYVLINDPALGPNRSDGMYVYYECPLETFLGFWRGVVYIVE